jgi:CrcB protein
MTKLLIIGMGGFIGAIARYSVSGLVHRYSSSSFPYGTLVVNVLGCLLIGGLLYLSEDRGIIPGHTRWFLSVGLLGAFTTFSTFGYETVELVAGSQLKLAMLNIIGNVVLGIFAVWLGRTALRTIGL